jgi:PAS domain S-box-containing protein
VFAIAATIISVFTFIIHTQNERGDKFRNLTILGYETIRVTRVINTAIVDMETGQRGYLITRLPEFLQPYTDADAKIDSYLEDLERVTAHDEDDHARALKVREKAIKVRDRFRQQMVLIKKGKLYALTTADLRITKVLMDDFRHEVIDMVNVELQKLSLIIEKTNRENKNFSAILIVGVGAVIGALLIMSLLISKFIERNREFEAELKTTHDRYNLILDNLEDGIYDYNVVTSHVSYSGAYEKMLGYNEGELPKNSQKLKELVHPEDLPGLEKSLKQFTDKETPTYSVVFRMKRKDGKWSWILSRAVGTWDEKGTLIRMLGIHTDITEQKRTEENIRELALDMESFIYITSHDLRGPLVNIKGFSTEAENSIRDLEKLLEPDIKKFPAGKKQQFYEILDKDIIESLNFIKSGVERMDRLTSSILELSRVGKREFRIEEVDPNIIVNRCIASLAYEIHTKDIAVNCDKLPRINSDSLALEQIIGNILDNAVKYIDPSRKGQIEIKYKELPWETNFIIKDNGRGIDQKDNKKVFDVFRRAGNTQDVRGMGMGLTYVRTLLRKLGGRIWFESTLNEGTTFYFSIPYTPLIKQETKAG